MSVKAITWAKETRTGNPTSKLVLISLADYADEHGRCWPSQATIARETELSERSVRRHLDRLEERQLISRHGRAPRPDGTFLTDVITLAFKPADKLSHGSKSNRRKLPADTVAKIQRTHSPKPADTESGNPLLIRHPEPSRVPIQGDEGREVVNTRKEKTSPYLSAKSGGEL